MTTIADEFAALLHLEREGALATVTLNRPRKLNALDSTLGNALVDALDRIAADAEIRVVVLTGAGRGFCAGGDLSEIKAVDAMDAGAEIAATRWMMRAVGLLHDMPQVTIAAINGACAGAGMGLALATDLRYAAESAVFNTAFLDVGLSSDYGLSWGLTQIVGPAKARELLLLPERISASEALALGLVSQVEPDATFSNLISAVTDRLLCASPIALRLMKRNLFESQRLTLTEMLDIEADRVTQCQVSGDVGVGAGP